MVDSGASCVVDPSRHWLHRSLENSPTSVSRHRFLHVSGRLPGLIEETIEVSTRALAMGYSAPNNLSPIMRNCYGYRFLPFVPSCGIVSRVYASTRPTCLQFGGTCCDGFHDGSLRLSRRRRTPRSSKRSPQGDHLDERTAPNTPSTQ